MNTKPDPGINHRTYVTFLGTSKYLPVAYHWQGQPLATTPYAQEAELGGPLATVAIDAVLVLGTATSRQMHWETPTGLCHRIKQLGHDPKFVEIPEELSPDAQWQTFELLLAHVGDRDHLILDITHGFRAVPVVLSSALHFLRLTRNVYLEHVFYGAYDSKPPAIVDYRDFYAIHDWTEAVARLVDEADARRLAEVAAQSGGLPMAGLADPQVTDALQRLTAAVRNVDVQLVGTVAREALQHIQAAELGATGASKVLLRLVLDKFAALAAAEPISGRYDGDYFRVQFVLVGLVLEHGLNMQAFTVMRELLCSLGLHVASGVVVRDLRGKDRHAKKARLRADIFGSLLRIAPEAWKFADDNGPVVAELRPWYDRLDAAGLVSLLRPLSKEIQDIRNGFDHAWTTAERSDVGAAGARLVAELAAVVEVLEQLPVPTP